MAANIELYEARVVRIDQEEKKITIEKMNTGVKYKLDLPKAVVGRHIPVGLCLMLEISYLNDGRPMYSLRFPDDQYTSETSYNAQISHSLYHRPSSSAPLTPSLPEIELACQSYSIRNFYHITHIKNLANIAEKGLLCRNEYTGYVDISNSEIQDHRHYKRVPPYPDLTLHDYVPLFIAPKPPMLSALRENQANLVYVCVTPKILQLPWSVFTDGNARSNATNFYVNICDLAKLDWNILRAHFWGDDDPEQHHENKRRRSAEVLIRECISPSYITWIVASNLQLLNEVQTILGATRLKIRTKIVPEFYY